MEKGTIIHGPTKKQILGAAKWYQVALASKGSPTSCKLLRWLRARCSLSSANPLVSEAYSLAGVCDCKAGVKSFEFESGSLDSCNFLPAAGTTWKCWNPRPAQCCMAGTLLLQGRAHCSAWIPLSSISWGYPRFGHCPGASGESGNLPVLGRQTFLEPTLAAGMQVRIR